MSEIAALIKLFQRLNVTATDGANNVKTGINQVNTNSPASKTSTFDLNGNMTSDGTNTFKWDAANR